MRIVETIAERRIRQAREDGLFDDLEGKGKPIADLGRERPPGWWALRQIKIERAKLAAEQASTAEHGDAIQSSTGPRKLR